MSLWELRDQAFKLSVGDRLVLVDAIIQSIHHDLKSRLRVPPGTLTGLRGTGKLDPSSTTRPDP
jgi:hypothetical protein